MFCICACHKEPMTEVLVSSNTPVSTDERGLSSILTVKRVIPLETNDNSLIGGDVRKILKYKGYIYVSFNRTTLLQFDVQGKFIRQIGNIGNGPGEFTLLGDFDVADSGIYIRSYMNVLQYTHDGSFVRSIPFKLNLYGIKVLDDRILGFVTRERNICHIFDLNGKQLDEFHPNSKIAAMGTSSYYWPYRDGKYIFDFYLSNDILVYDTKDKEYNYMQMIDLPDMMTLDKANNLWEDRGKNTDLREYATYIWPFNSNGNQLYFITHENVKDEGILWGQHIAENRSFAYDCNHMKNDITYIPTKNFFSSFTRSDDSFLSFISPGDLKEAIAETDDTSSLYYAQMKVLADSLTEEDNYILVEYEFK